MISLFRYLLLILKGLLARLAISVSLLTNVPVAAAIHCDGRSTNAVVVIGVIVRASWEKTGWGLVFVSLAFFLICIAIWERRMRPWVESLTTLLCLKMCKPTTGPVNFFTTTNCSAKVCFPRSNQIVPVAYGFSNSPFATWIWRTARSSTLKKLALACCLILSSSFWATAVR